MNITPKSIFKGTNSDGSNFKMEEWDFGTLAQIELVSFVCTMLMVVMLSAFIPITLLILTIIFFNGRFALANVVGLIGGIYFLYDCSHGWFVVQILSMIFSESLVTVLYGLNLGAVIGHIIIILLGTSLFNGANENKTTFGVVIMLAVFVSLFIGIGTHKKGWIEANVHPYVAPVIDNRSFEQIKADADKQYEADRVAHGYSAKNPYDK